MRHVQIHAVGQSTTGRVTTDDGEWHVTYRPGEGWRCGCGADRSGPVCEHVTAVREAWQRMTGGGS